jgi:hypothetical protein
MLVSSHTICVWDGWKHVPPDIDGAISEKPDKAWIFFIPKAVFNEGRFVDEATFFLPSDLPNGADLTKVVKTYVLPIGAVFVVATAEQGARVEKNSDEG